MHHRLQCNTNRLLRKVKSYVDSFGFEVMTKKKLLVQSTLLNVNTGKVNTLPYSNTSLGHKVKEKGTLIKQD